VITRWQFPTGALEDAAVAELWAGVAGVGVAAGVACSVGAAEFCTVKSAGAWLVTSGAATNK
jgi:O-acetylhomoserine/O-acetylserine sulfhydrylase-like pyridoxal-dependent enzyme